MEKKTKTVRFFIRNGKAGNIVPLVPEIKTPDDASRGYF